MIYLPSRLANSYKRIIIYYVPYRERDVTRSGPRCVSGLGFQDSWSGTNRMCVFIG